MQYLWETFDDDDLLELRLCDLKIDLKSTHVAPLIKQLNAELDKKGIVFRPHLWISDDWFCADGIPGIAIPFFSLHPRLIKLERTMMGKIDGSTERTIMQLLRHECGHAIDNAYRLRGRKERVEIFGLSSSKYPSTYSYRPFSKDYVRHLTEGYAQAHPEEDWAETFAVWLDPKSNWKKKYAKWGAIRKLNYLNKQMLELKGQKPAVINQDCIDKLADSSLTLRKYYERKALCKGMMRRPFFGKRLSSIFSKEGRISSKSLVLKKKNLVLKNVSKETGLYHYEIEPMLKDLLKEAANCGPYVRAGIKKPEVEISKLLIQESSRFKRQGRHRIIM